MKTIILFLAMLLAMIIFLGSMSLSASLSPTASIFGSAGDWPVGTFIVKVNGGDASPSQFTIRIISPEGGIATPESFSDDGTGTLVTLSGGGTFEMAPNTEPGYIRSLGNNCLEAFSSPGLPQRFECTITFTQIGLAEEEPAPAAPVDTGREMPLAEQMPQMSTIPSPSPPPPPQPSMSENTPPSPQQKPGTEICDNNGNGLLDTEDIQCMAQLCGSVTGRSILADPSICDSFPLPPAQDATQPPPEPDDTMTTTPTPPPPPPPPPTTTPTDGTTAAPPPPPPTTTPPSPTDGTIPAIPPSPPVEPQPPEPLSVCPLRISPSLKVLTAIHGEPDSTIPTGCNYSKVEVRATSAGSGSVQLQSKHLFVIYTDENGKEYVYRGGHGGPWSTQNPLDYPFGSITAVAEEYEVGANDWDPMAITVTVLEGKAAQDKGNCFANLINPINAAKIDYELEGPNSNTVAWTLLTKCEIPPNKPAGWFPGWGGSDLMTVQTEKRQ